MFGDKSQQYRRKVAKKAFRKAQEIISEQPKGILIAQAATGKFGKRPVPKAIFRFAGETGAVLRSRMFWVSLVASTIAGIGTSILGETVGQTIRQRQETKAIQQSKTATPLQALDPAYSQYLE